MYHISINPLSLNHAYRGRRFDTQELRQYKNDLAILLPKLEVPHGKLSVQYEFGVSSKASDGDNLVKCLQDAIASKYGFNDKDIYEWKFCKVDVKKGEEYIKFDLTEYKKDAP